MYVTYKCVRLTEMCVCVLRCPCLWKVYGTIWDGLVTNRQAALGALTSNLESAN